MPKGYKHLTQETRYLIYALKKSGQSPAKIAGVVGYTQRTVERELKRNKGKNGYNPEEAQAKADERRHRKKPHLSKMTPETIALIEEKLTECQWSPEQIAGWLANAHPDHSVSHELIYQHIWAEKRRDGTLYKQLRRHGKKYQKRSNGKTNRGQIIGRVPISERPPEVETRERYGDWEADTIVGKGRTMALVTVVERKSRYIIIRLVPRSTAEEVSRAMIEALQGGLPLHTITSDNGKEFAKHLNVAKALGVSTYFATPYHSWERGLNENTNGLIRQYWPKGTDFSQVTPEEVAKVELLLNQRPRQCLGYTTPEGVLPRAS